LPCFATPVADTIAEAQSKLISVLRRELAALKQQLAAATTDRSMAAQLLVADVVVVAEELQRRAPATKGTPSTALVPTAMQGAVAVVCAWTEASSCAVTRQVLRDVYVAEAARERLDAAMEAVRGAVDTDAGPIAAAVVEERDTARAEYITACRTTVKGARSSFELLDTAEHELQEQLCALAAASAAIGTSSSPALDAANDNDDNDNASAVTPVAHVVRSARDAVALWSDTSSSEAAKATSTLQGLLGRYFEVCSATGSTKDPALLVDGLPLACQALGDALQAENDRVAQHHATFPSPPLVAALKAMQADANAQLEAIARVREAAVEYEAAAQYQAVDRPDPAAAREAQKAARAAKRELNDAVDALDDAIHDDGPESDAAAGCRAELATAKRK
jgi:hypothetical protein